MPMFCRHNRLTARCSICAREMEADTKARIGTAARPARTPSSPRRPAGRQAGRVVTKRLARAADDGYRNALLPGVKATADAERLGAAMAVATARLEFPGPRPAVAEESDPDQATWLAFLLVLMGPDVDGAIVANAPSWVSGEVPDPPAERTRTVLAYRAWAQRAGGQAAAFLGEPGWTPERRFGRVFERLALPGFPRAARFELLVTLGAAGVYELRADALHAAVKEDDPTTLGAKRALVSGDAMLLERRARDLAEACAVPLGALDRAFAWWEQGEDAGGEPTPAIRQALAL